MKASFQLSRRRALSSVWGCAIAALVPVPALAASVMPFTEREFAAGRQADRPMLIDVTAPWCPTCRIQRPIILKLLDLPKFKDYLAFEIDFDSQKDLLRRFKVNMQSTLIAFRGEDEMGRTVGDTKASSIESLLDMAL